MKRILFYSIIVIFFAACSKSEKYQIDGLMKQKKEGTIFLQQRINKEYVSIDSSKIVDGSFSFEGEVGSVDEYYLSISGKDRKLFFLENNRILVEVDSLLEDALVEGGEVQTLFNTYSDKYKRLYDFMLTEYYQSREIEDEIERNAKEAYVDSLYESIETFQEVFLKENTSSPVAVYILSRIQYGKSLEELNGLFSLLNNSLSGMIAYQELASRIEELKLLAVGQSAPDFTQNDVEGNPVALSDIYSQHKLTLVDFWASWCGPCRSENPNVVAAFEKFNSKGFTVLGVSLDKDKERWIKAIEEDGLVWQHVSDLKGWDNAFSKAYAVNSIPANFLIDQNGIIVAHGLREDELLSKLDEILNK